MIASLAFFVKNPYTHPTMPFFELVHKEKHTRARAGVIHTGHGDIETPIFMPVGTQATVKSLDPRDIAEVGAQIILANTYHLHLRPGEDLIAASGGLHQFMKWNGPILTDSGGFQVLSLGQQREKKLRSSPHHLITQSPDHNNEPTESQGRLVRIDDDGVTFRSHIDGSTHRFTPESAIETQHKLGADIIMAFDECTPDDASEEYTRQAMERTHRWAERSLRHHNLKSKFQNLKSHLFGIIQGANNQKLRVRSAQYISSLDFDGIAIGGESVGYNMEATKNILDWVIPLIPEDKPHYAMGLGFAPLDLFEVVERGVDMFDCVAPTRIARNGTLYAHPDTLRELGANEIQLGQSRFSITNARFREDQNPIDPRCACAVCATFSRAYLHHLFAAEELLAYRLATIHNLSFFLNLMKEMRAAILEDRFLDLKKEWMPIV